MKIWNILLLIAVALALTAVSLKMGQQAYSWFPPQASAESQLIDRLFSFLTVLGTFIFLGVTGTLLYSVVFQQAAKYDMSDGPPIEGNITLEVVWTVIPILLVVWIATYSYNVYQQMAITGPMEMTHKMASATPLDNPAAEKNEMYAKQGPMEMTHNTESEALDTEDAIANPIVLETSPEPAEKIEVFAKQWSWVFRYPENVTSSELHLPNNRRIRLLMQSADVIHGFYIPAFRLKQDIIPQQPINFEFTPIRLGTYRLTDSQYSGTYFATMSANVVVQDPEDYKKWLVDAASRKPTLASNQAAAEYFRESEKPIKTSWPTVVPVAPPLVNYHSEQDKR